jgi:hypothetical protein
LLGNIIKNYKKLTKVSDFFTKHDTKLAPRHSVKRHVAEWSIAVLLFYCALLIVVLLYVALLNVMWQSKKLVSRNY